MFFCPPSVASASPRPACAQGRRGPPAASRWGPQPLRQVSCFLQGLPALGTARARPPCLVHSCPAPPLPKAASSGRARRELSSCASHLPDPGSADPGGCRRSREPSCPVRPERAPRDAAEGARGSRSLVSSASAFPCGCCTCRARRSCSLDGQPRVSATAPSSLRKGPGNALLAGPAFPSTSLVSRNAASPAGGPPARPLLQEPPVKRVVLTNSPRVSRTFPPGSSRPL